MDDKFFFQHITKAALVKQMEEASDKMFGALVKGTKQPTERAKQLLKVIAGEDNDESHFGNYTEAVISLAEVLIGEELMPFYLKDRGKIKTVNLAPFKIIENSEGYVNYFEDGDYGIRRVLIC